MKRVTDTATTESQKKLKSESASINLVTLLQAADKLSYEDSLVLAQKLARRIIEHRAYIIQRLPDEVWAHMFTYIGISELVSCSSVCSSWKQITDIVLVLHFSEFKFKSDGFLRKFTGLTSLDISRTLIGDRGVEELTSLTDLTVNARISDQGIRNLTNLTHLNLMENCQISGKRFKHLSKLQRIELNGNEKSEDFANLSNLTWLRFHLLSSSSEAPVLPNLAVLDLRNNGSITNSYVSQLTNLTALNLHKNSVITSTGFSLLTKLKILNLRSNTQINDRALSQLTHLQELQLSENILISDRGLRSLTGLTNLSLANTLSVSGSCFEHLTNLTQLNIAGTQIGNNISYLINLLSLILSENFEVRDESLSNLTKLRSLSLYFTDQVTDEALSFLPNLTYLNISRNNNITDDGLSLVTKLEELDIGSNIMITERGIIPLKKLRRLKISPANPLIENIQPLSALEYEIDFGPEVYEREVYGDDLWTI